MSAIDPPRATGRTVNHKPKKTAMLLAQRIVSEIVDRGLGPGTPLLAERSMLDDYGVARGTLRGHPPAMRRKILRQLLRRQVALGDVSSEPQSHFRSSFRRKPGPKIRVTKSVSTE